MTSIRPLLAAALACVAVGALLPDQAAAALEPAACKTSFDVPGARCGTLTVPIDRRGVVRGKVKLFVERVPARRKRKAAIVVFPGGPGAATSILGPDVVRVFGASALADHDLLLFDQRGTGRSGYLDCDSALTPNYYRPTGEAARELGKTVERCAKRLGARRAFYTTRDTVADLEAIRAALRIEKLLLFGVSYGTRSAMAYAREYPNRVSAVVLDSLVSEEGLDAFRLNLVHAVPRVLRQLCRAGGCDGITADPVADLAQLVQRLRQGPIRPRKAAQVGRCRLRPAITRSRLFALFEQADLDPELLSALPVAIAEAARGRPYQLSLLQAATSPYLFGCAVAEMFANAISPPARGLRDDIELIQRSFSIGEYVATLCEESRLPWPRTAPPSMRGRLAEEALAPFGDDAFAPFDRATVLAASLVPLCKFWRAAPDPPLTSDAPLPDVPTLVLAGLDDLRTPAEDALAVARTTRRGHLLLVPDVGHSVLDASGCARRGLRRFMAGQTIGECHRRAQHSPRPLRRVPSLESSLGKLFEDFPLG